MEAKKTKEHKDKTENAQGLHSFDNFCYPWKWMDTVRRNNMKINREWTKYEHRIA